MWRRCRWRADRGSAGPGRSAWCAIVGAFYLAVAPVVHALAGAAVSADMAGLVAASWTWENRSTLADRLHVGLTFALGALAMMVPAGLLGRLTWLLV